MFNWKTLRNYHKINKFTGLLINLKTLYAFLDKIHTTWIWFGALEIHIKHGFQQNCANILRWDFFAACFSV